MPFVRRWLWSASLVAMLALACAAGALVAQVRQADRPGPLGVARVWHGRTPAAKADEYAKYILDGDIRQIRSLAGNLGVQVLRRTDGAFVDFVVLSYWPSRDAIRQWAGENLEQAKYSDKEREYLINPEPTVTHYDIVFNEGRATR